MVSELGGAAAFSGLQTRGLPGYRGRLSPNRCEPPPMPTAAFTRRERQWSRREHAQHGRRDRVAARRAPGSRGDSARASDPHPSRRCAPANASVAQRVAPAELAGCFDTATLCLSKGLGCPLGALIAGSAELMHHARREKHRFGGAMRQAGIPAAAGLYALDHNVERLADDHARARRLAEGWAAAGLPVDLALAETNFVQLDVGSVGLGEWEAVGLLRDAGVLLSRTMSRVCCALPRTSISTTTTSRRLYDSFPRPWAGVSGQPEALPSPSPFPPPAPATPSPVTPRNNRRHPVPDRVIRRLTQRHPPPNRPPRPPGPPITGLPHTLPSNSGTAIYALPNGRLWPTLDPPSLLQFQPSLAPRSDGRVDDDDAAVEGDEQEALHRLDRPSQMTSVDTAAASAIVDSSTTRNDRGRLRPTSGESRATTGATKTATCIDELIAISVASLMFPRCAITTAPPCSAALPTIATITVAMKNSLSPREFPNPRSECTRISEICAVARVAIVSRTSAFRIDHAPTRGARRSASRWMRRLRLVITRYRDEDDRHRDREQVQRVVAERTVPGGNGRNQQ